MILSKVFKLSTATYNEERAHLTLSTMCGLWCDVVWFGLIGIVKALAWLGMPLIRREPREGQRE